VSSRSRRPPTTLRSASGLAADACRESRPGARSDLTAHFIIGQDGWEEVADYALSWATEHARASAAA
jgi:hypothetical protein